MSRRVAILAISSGRRRREAASDTWSRTRLFGKDSTTRFDYDALLMERIWAVSENFEAFIEFSSHKWKIPGLNGLI